MAPLAIACAFIGQAFSQTSPPPQLQTTNQLGFFRVGWTLEAFWRVANNGTAPTQWRLGMDILNSGTPNAAFYFYDFSGSPYFGGTALSQNGGTGAVSARCGNYDGYFAGEWYDSAASAVVPAYWSSSSANPTPVLDGLNAYPGVFTDMTSDAAGPYFAGYYVNGSVQIPAVWSTSFMANSPVILGSSGFSDGAQALGMNNNLDLVGEAFGTTNPPVMWQYVSGTTWTLIDITDSGHLGTDWPSGRDGYLIGITDRKSGDSNGPYAVGYMCPTTPSSNDGQPFIYSVGANVVKFLGSAYGAPTQVSNRGYDASDPVVSFSGSSSSRPYIYVGSPDPLSSFNGAADDVWAFLDPDSPAYNSTYAPTATGINKDFAFGGQGMQNTNEPYLTAATSWSQVDPLDMTWTLAWGSLASGSYLSGLYHADGKFTQVINSPSVALTEIDFVAPVCSASSVAVRVTSRLDANLTEGYEIDLWNVNTSKWVSFPLSAMAQFWRTDLVQTSDVADYVDGSGNFMARIMAKPTSQPSHKWTTSYDQAVVLWK